MQTTTPSSTSPDIEHELRENFGLFVYHLWRELKLPPPTRLQTDIAGFLHHGPRRRVVKAFRGVGKSWLTAAYVLWLLLRDRNERILVVSASKDRADGFTVFVRRLIEDVWFLKCLKPLEGQRDSVVAFDVAGSEPHQSPSVKSASITGQITGSRATRIIADDIEIPRNSMTQTMRERLSEQVKEFDAIILPGGSITYLGTDQTEMSLYKALPARGYTVRIWPARVPLKTKIPAYGDTLAPIISDLKLAHQAPTDPERFNERDLIEREASYGRSGFAMQFMLDPSIGDAEKYPLKCSDFIVLDTQPEMVPTQVVWGSDPKLQKIEDLECLGLTGDRWHRPMHVGDTFAAPSPAVMFIDPAGRGRDECAVAVGRAFGPRVFISAVEAWMDGYAEATLKAITELARAEQVKLVLVEPNFGGGMYTNLLAQAMRKYGYPCTIEDSKHVRTQKEVRIIDTLEPLLVQHRVVLARRVVERDLAVREARSSTVGEDSAGDYCLQYQLTRLTRERGCLRHEDRLEALAGVCEYFCDAQAQTEADAHEAELERLRDLEVERFLFDVDNPLQATEWAPANSSWAEVRGAAGRKVH